MRILYGVQGTGQGHISRARAMAKALSSLPVEVDWLFSGRARENFFDMEPFGEFLHRRGLTFTTHAGRISYLRTLRDNNLWQFRQDVRQLDLSRYDLVVTDFEPVSAWAGIRAGVPTVGIGHQYAFGPGTPTCGSSLLGRIIMRNFAPADIRLGLHWHPYSSKVLPPILDLPSLECRRGDHILVYLPFEDQQAVTRWLAAFPGLSFRQYAPGLCASRQGNITLHPTSTSAFKRDLANSRGVICNSGFELISECLQWGKPVLTRPLAGQMEQLSNAHALEQLGYARITHTLDTRILASWLDGVSEAPRIRFADVSHELAQWLAGGCRLPPETLHERLWASSAGIAPPGPQRCGPALLKAAS